MTAASHLTGPRWTPQLWLPTKPNLHGGRRHPGPFWKDTGHLLHLAPSMTCHHKIQMHRTVYGGPPACSGVPPGSPQSQSQETYRQPGAWQTLQTQPLVLGAAQAPTVPGGVPPPGETACKPQHQHCRETVSSCWEQKASCLPWRWRSIPQTPEGRAG